MLLRSGTDCGTVLILKVFKKSAGPGHTKPVGQRTVIRTLIVGTPLPPGISGPFISWLNFEICLLIGVLAPPSPSVYGLVTAQLTLGPVHSLTIACV